MNAATETAATKTIARLRGVARDHGGIASIEQSVVATRIVAHFTARDSAVSAAARYLTVLHAARVEVVEEEDVAAHAREEGYRTALVIDA